MHVIKNFWLSPWRANTWRRLEVANRSRQIAWHRIYRQYFTDPKIQGLCLWRKCSARVSEFETKLHCRRHGDALYTPQSHFEGHWWRARLSGDVEVNHSGTILIKFPVDF